ncbi:MAG TPA: succinate dehydrogenase iron-sulfur subunit [Bacteroidetes bacterium]|nr:succinate dehydrogenase iron-sulfur subunit [Bacteroidota bacterium]HEX05394.1 succinate dehydrogenase iron-sulfur subunit [Bacteroidota bacterium]
MAKRSFKIFRFNPETDNKPSYQTYEVECESWWTVLDALNQIKWFMDGTMTYRRSCRHGICGSCAVMINGKNDLACELQIQTLKGTIKIDPLPGFEIYRDLSVNMEPFYAALKRVKPWLINDDPPPSTERYQSPDDFKLMGDSIACILCGACTSSCPSFWADEQYLGPAALLKAFRYSFDTRDKGLADRIEALDNEHGLWRCHKITNCYHACPKHLNPTEQISKLQRRIIEEKM